MGAKGQMSLVPTTSKMLLLWIYQENVKKTKACMVLSKTSKTGVSLVESINLCLSSRRATRMLYASQTTTRM